MMISNREKDSYYFKLPSTDDKITEKDISKIDSKEYIGLNSDDEYYTFRKNSEKINSMVLPKNRPDN